MYLKFRRILCNTIFKNPTFFETSTISLPIAYTLVARTSTRSEKLFEKTQKIESILESVIQQRIGIKKTPNIKL